MLGHGELDSGHLKSSLLSESMIQLCSSFDLLLVHESVYEAGQRPHMKVRGQPMGVPFLFPTHRFQGLNSGHTGLVIPSLHMNPSFWLPPVLSKLPIRVSREPPMKNKGQSHRQWTLHWQPSALVNMTEASQYNHSVE